MKYTYKYRIFAVPAFIGVLLLVPGIGQAGATDWRISSQTSYFGSHESSIVSGSICDKPGDLSRAYQGLSCLPCPSYTGNAGDSELEVTRIMHGSFSRPGAKEILVNTSGCEPRSHNLGGAVLLETIKSKRKRIAYMPGFDLDDCIVSKGEDKKHHLLCNEVSQGQGQLVGQLSIFKMGAESLERWRLLRWYDNLGSGTSDKVSITPKSARFIDINKDGVGDIEIVLSVNKLPSGSPQLKKSLPIKYIRDGNRYFPTQDSQKILGDLSVILESYIE